MITDEDEAAARVVQMVTKGTVVAVTGAEIPVEADSICLHGDSRKAVLFAQKIHGALQDAGIRIRPMGEA